MTKVSDHTIRMISQLSQETRLKVDKVIRKHVAACVRNGSPVENLDRLFIEAVEVVKLEERFPEYSYGDRIERTDWEPFRHYDQYSSPRDM